MITKRRLPPRAAGRPEPQCRPKDNMRDNRGFPPAESLLCCEQGNPAVTERSTKRIANRDDRRANHG